MTRSCALGCGAQFTSARHGTAPKSWAPARLNFGDGRCVAAYVCPDCLGAAVQAADDANERTRRAFMEADG